MQDIQRLNSFRERHRKLVWLIREEKVRLKQVRNFIASIVAVIFVTTLACIFASLTLATICVVLAIIYGAISPVLAIEAINWETTLHKQHYNMMETQHDAINYYQSIEGTLEAAENGLTLEEIEEANKVTNIMRKMLKV